MGCYRHPPRPPGLFLPTARLVQLPFARCAMRVQRQPRSPTLFQLPLRRAAMPAA